MNVAWITTVDEDDARGETAEAFAQCCNKKTGRAAHILKVHSLNPRAMAEHYTLYRTLVYGPSPLARYQREMIGTVVSALNGCHY
ncbi:MAG: peroxidase [Anaerolineae bacterium]|nr:peroxidase [Anaerolineae bacterium]